MARPRYAIVETSDWRYIAGINGQLNAMKYYQFDKNVEFHLIHTFPDSNGYIDKAKSIFPNLVATKISDLREQYGSKYSHIGLDSPKNTKSVMKYWRWIYPIERLMDYDAICILDADRQICNNMLQWFKVTDRSEMILVAKNDYSNAEWNSYDAKRAMQAQPPLYSNPYFAKPAVVKDLFKMIPEYAVERNTGDMHPVNLTLLDTGLINDVLFLPATLWVFVQVDCVSLRRRIVNNKYYLGIHKYGDLLYTFHRRYWGQRVTQRMANGHGVWGKANGRNNVQLFWEHTKYMNTELYLKLDWIWGDLRLD